MRSFVIVCLYLLILVSPTDFASGRILDALVVSKKCGGVQLSLRCPTLGGGKANCIRPLLILHTGDNKFATIGAPKGLEKHSPIGLGCVTSPKDHSNYFVVEYSDLPTGCDICEWYHLYNSQGKLLTSSYPSIVTIQNASPAQSVAPNNNNFDKLSKDLELEKPKIKSIVCEGPHIDANGTPFCQVGLSHVK